MSLAQRVRDYRYSKGWGPDELASRAAISRTALYQIESGKTELPRAGTLRRIALALDVSMETLLGHPDGVGGVAVSMPLHQEVTTRSRGSSNWFPGEGAPMATLGSRSSGKFDVQEGPRYSVEFAAGHDGAMIGRERELVLKLHELLASPFGDAVARIVEESHRLLPQARVAGGYE
jgi:transcriptional regulator with XRE-family HTH domain